MRVLVLSCVDPTDSMSGIGSLIRNTIRSLATTPGLQVSVGVLTTSPGEIDLAQIGAEGLMGRPVIDVRRPADNRLLILRSLVGGLLTAAERRFLARVREVSREVDAVVWFGSAWDPVTMLLPLRCACPVVHHASDSIALFEKRRGARFNPRLPLAVWQERRVLRAGSAATVYVSDVDEAQVARRMGGEVAPTRVLPLGIDLSHFHPRPQVTDGAAALPVILFTGAMAYGPNVEAATFLVRRVLPRLSTRVRLVVAGREPVPAVRALATDDGRVEVTGRVPDMVAQYHRADVFVAPIRSGAGFKSKILEALACGIPVVTTAMGLEGYPATPPGVVVAEDEVAFARAIDALLADPGRRGELGRSGRAYVEAGWSWDARTRRLVEFMTELQGARC